MKKILLAACCVPFFTSCVTRRLYNELDTKYKNCAEELERLTGESTGLKSQSFDLGTKNQSLQAQLEDAVTERDKLKIAYEQLEKDYKSLEKNSDSAIKAEIERLNSLKKELDGKSSRVAELEGKLAAQDKNLKN